MKRIGLVLLICFFFIQCGYRLQGTGGSLPPYIKKISIPMFKNLTTRFELDLKLTRGVIDEMVSRGNVEIIADKSSADAIIIGEVVSFRAIPIAFSEEATADRYNIIVVAKIILRDLTNQKILFSDPHFVYHEEYEVPEGTDFETVESEALDSIAEKFSRSLVAAILEGF